MNLLDLRTEVSSRGFDFATSARLNTWINRAYHRACERHPWPFLQVTVTGTSPLAITDLRNVLSVIDTTTKATLGWEDRRNIYERDPTLDVTGSPTSWYLDGSNLTVYPANTTDSIQVWYLKVPSDLTADSDTPLFPARFHYLIVDGACAMAYEDSDNFDAASLCWQSFWGQIEEMASNLLVPNFDTPAEVAVYGGVDW